VERARVVSLSAAFRHFSLPDSLKSHQDGFFDVLEKLAPGG
jgi:hypothetical protein